KLPLKFVRRYGSDITSVAKLSLPNGNTWQVDVEKKRKEDGSKEEEIWLTKGWGEFMEHHSISKGFFLVFQYRGHSVFDVDIFNLTTCSISYPPPQESGSPEIIAVSDEEDDEKDDKFDGDEMENTLERLKASGMVTSHWLCSRIRKMYIKCNKGIEDAMLASNPQHHSFILVLNSDDCEGKCRPVIPVSFAREHILDRGNISVVLQTAKQNWRVEVRKRRTKSGSIFCVTFGKGWRQFKEDNNLGEGDVCLLHLISPEDLVLAVSIFPAAL
ncbi:Putative B3 domain-containing protein Os03g0621600, partial [Linum grandiflorum]